MRVRDNGFSLSSKLDGLTEIAYTNKPERKFTIMAGEVGLWFLQRATDLYLCSRDSVKLANVTYVKGLLMYISLNYKHGPWKVKVYRDKTYRYHFYYGTKLVFVSDKLDGHDLNEYLTT